MRTTVMKQPMVRARDGLVAAIFAMAVPSIALADDAGISLQVAPGATLQVRVCASDPNEPTPIIVDQLGPDFSSLGVSLLGAPDAAGTALIAGDSMIIRSVSPASATGLPTSPRVAVTVAVSDQASSGTTLNLTG